MIRAKIHKMTAEGEQLDIEVDVRPGRDWSEDLAPAFALLDQRLLEMNSRLLHAFKTLEYFPPELRGAIKVLLDALHHGRVDQLGTIPQLIQQASMRPEESPNG